MSNVISFDPFRELENMFKRYNDPLSRNYIAKENESMMSGSWAPLVDIKETKDAYIIKGELPGMDKDDVNVSIDKNNTIDMVNEIIVKKTVIFLLNKDWKAILINIFISQ